MFVAKEMTREIGKTAKKFQVPMMISFPRKRYKIISAKERPQRPCCKKNGLLF